MSCSSIPVIRAGDRANPMVAVLADKTIDSSGDETLAVKDLTPSGTSVTAYLRERNESTNLLSIACTISDGSVGEVEVPWPANWEDDLPDEGETDALFDMFFVVTLTAGDVTVDEPALLRIKPKVSA